ncbi:hypothetical protein AWB95_21420 [Mycobacterium celatum]|uniref:Secreted protein n=1 Tax=Mycobacterium celatum TaxID=28045 RepID=A0A1X1RIP6_MYCCE|nr:hypothetical protein AWB95_21420 [Mycobacterium celatum]
MPLTIFAWLPRLWLLVAAPSSAEANDAPAIPMAPAAAMAAAANALVLIFKMIHSFFVFNRLRWRLRCDGLLPTPAHYADSVEPRCRQR